MHSADALAPELCQQLRLVRRLRSECSRLAREYLAEDVEYSKATIVRGNRAICIILRCLSRIRPSAR